MTFFFSLASYPGHEKQLFLPILTVYGLSTARDQVAMSVVTRSQTAPAPNYRHMPLGVFIFVISFEQNRLRGNFEALKPRKEETGRNKAGQKIDDRSLSSPALGPATAQANGMAAASFCQGDC